VNSRSHSLYAIARPSVVCMSVTLVPPSSQAVEIFGNFSKSFGTLATRWRPWKIYGDVPGEPLRRGDGVETQEG